MYASHTDLDGIAKLERGPRRGSVALMASYALVCAAFTDLSMFCSCHKECSCSEDEYVHDACSRTRHARQHTHAGHNNMHA